MPSRSSDKSRAGAAQRKKRSYAETGKACEVLPEAARRKRRISAASAKRRVRPSFDKLRTRLVWLARDCQPSGELVEPRRCRVRPSFDKLRTKVACVARDCQPSGELVEPWQGGCGPMSPC